MNAHGTEPVKDISHDYAAILRRQAEVMDDPDELLYAAHYIERLQAAATELMTAVERSHDAAEWFESIVKLKKAL
jgi:hypothetical protein